MIPKSDLQKFLFFDVETVGSYETFEELQTENPKLAELWSKRCHWLRVNSGQEHVSLSDSELWKEKATLHPEFGKIVCISMASFCDGELKMNSYTGDEAEILNKMNKVLDNCASVGFKLAGHTIKNFDIPYIGKRMLAHGIKPSSMISPYNKKPWEMNVVDITNIFSFGSPGQSFTSLDLMCCVLGVPSPKEEMDGSMVHSYYYQGRIEDIQNYCERDVVSLVKCFEEMSSNA